MVARNELPKKLMWSISKGNNPSSYTKLGRYTYVRKLRQMRRKWVSHRILGKGHGIMRDVPLINF